MERIECTNKKLKNVMVLSVVVGTICLYLLKGHTYDVTTVYPANVTSSSIHTQNYGYRLHRKIHSGARDQNKSLIESVTERTSEMVTEGTRFTSVTPAVSVTLTNSSKKSPSKQTIGKTLLDENFKSNVSNMSSYDILATKSLKFDPAYKNPCWTGKGGNGPMADRKLHCLPYFYIVGVKKSGTTDLYERIMDHPDVCSPGFKESQWLTRLRFGYKAPLLRLNKIHELFRSGPDVRSLAFYISMYDGAAACIKSQHLQPYNRITGDATPALFHMHTNWEQLPGNEGLEEPRYTNFHYISHITPQAKIIILFRDPVSRIYSDFHHIMTRTKMENAPQLFHDHVTKLVEVYRDCFRDHPLRRCIYNNTMRRTLMQDGVKLAESFHAGFYAFFMKELFSVFRRDQLLPLLMQDYTDDMKATLNKVFRFLELGPVDKSTADKILSEGVKNSGQLRKSHSGDMFEKTKTLLKQFFKPYNIEMANLMGDKRYKFEEL